MKNKIIGVASIILAATSLAACSNNSAQPKKASTQSASKVVSHKKNTTSTSIVGTYQDKENNTAILFKKDGTGRYVSGNDNTDAKVIWQKKDNTTYKVTVNDDKSISHLNAKINKNQLILNGSGNWKTEVFNRVTDGKLNLDNFLNKNKQATTSSSVSKQNSTNSSNTQSKITGDAGLFDIPTDLQGTWYSGDNVDKDDTSISKITIDAHTISYPSEDNGGTITLHKMMKDFDFQKYVQDQTYVKATTNWGRAIMLNIDGHSILNVRSWLQSAGDGNYYYLTQENGQTVLVSASGAGVWADMVYWKDEASAKKYANTKFDNIRTREDDTSPDNTDEDD